MHDDLFDFFYQALPGYEEVGRRRILLGCWGALPRPAVCDFTYQNMADWGRGMFVTPGVVVDGQLVTNSLVDINLGIRILLGHSYYEDWEDQEMFVERDPLGNPVDRRHPWNQHTIPRPPKRDFDDKYSWVMAPRWFDGTDHLAAGLRRRPAGPAVVHRARRPRRQRLRAVHRPQRRHQPAAHGQPSPRSTFEWKSSRSGATPWSATGPGPTSRPTPRPRAVLRRAGAGRGPGRAHQDLVRLQGARETIGVGFTEAVRGVLSHHMVIRDGNIANYHPYPPTPWNASARDTYGTPGPYEDAVQNTPIFEENTADRFKGIDIMRAVRSFDPCLPCGVHMYLGDGKTLRTTHTPTAVALAV